MDGNGRISAATLMFVMATFALDAYSSLNSSPQTTEINASARAETLMKWVTVADIVGLGGGLAAWAISGKPAAFLGSAFVVVGMHLMYEHAKRSGLDNPGPSTERY